MKLEDIPDFAKPYKKRGYDVRLRKGVYTLLKVTSRRVPGKKNPVLVQEYLGVIDPEKGLLPKKLKPDPQKPPLEYGLSRFLMANFKRELQRSCSGSDVQLVSTRLAVVQFIYGGYEKELLDLTAIGADPELRKAAARISGERIGKLALKLGKLVEQAVPDEADRRWLLGCLRQVTVPAAPPEGAAAAAPAGMGNARLLGILKKYSLKA